jgi:UDP-glucose 4-epimerase
MTRGGFGGSKTIDQMCEDHWRWQKSNPHGYDG